MLEEKTSLLEPAASDSDDGEDGALSIIQFSTAIYFVEETEGKALVDVVRLGNAEAVASCTYTTADGSARAGVKYTATSGTLRFEPEEKEKTIEIDISNNGIWDATLEFHVHLKHARGAQLGKYLHQCMVRIIDDDAFPTNMYRDQCTDEGKIERIRGPSLMMEYVKMSMTNEFIQSGTVKKVLMDQVANLHFFMTLYLQLYLVDVVLEGGGEGGGEGEEEYSERRLMLQGIQAAARRLEEASEAGMEEPLLVPGSRRSTAIVVGILYIVPFAINHVVDLWKLSLGLGGLARKTLQVNLLRKFLNYTEAVRAEISPGDLTMAMTRDVTEVVDFGFLKIFQVLRIMGKFGLALVFVLSENKMAAYPLLLFPVILGLWLVIREKVLIDSIENAADAQNEMVHAVNDAITNYSLIRDFSIRPFVLADYERLLEQFNQKAKDSQHVITNNMYLSPWLTYILIGLYIIFGTMEVEALGGDLSLGAFLATINVFKEIGKELQEIYVETMEVQKTFGPLKRLTFFLNRETDLPLRMRVNRGRRQVGKVRRENERKNSKGKSSFQRLQSGSGPQFNVDRLKIELNDVTYAYDDFHPVVRSVTEHFPQGQMYAFIGHPHQGKATLLKLLGQVLVPQPDKGEAFVPPHLRVLHLCREPLYLDKSFIRNIIFSQSIELCGGWKRVMAICRRCGFSRAMMSLLQEEKDRFERNGDRAYHGAARDWSMGFAQSDFARLNLARALVMNAECLVAHLPLVAFSDDEAAEMLQLMRMHIDERGLELSEEGRELRRPRTVFFSSSALDRCGQADVVYEVSAEHGLKSVGGLRFIKVISERSQLS